MRIAEGFFIYMAKNKSDQMPHYEVLYLISNQFSEDELGPVKAKVEKLITNNNGAITRQETLGKKRLAYKIKQFRHGYYELAEFNAPAEALPKINEQLRLDSDVLRYQIVKSEPKTAEQLAKEARVMSELLKAKKEGEPTEPNRKIKREAMADKAPYSAPKLAETAKDDKDKVELSDLDDKLNQILDTDNLL
jgi:small subunit ribosomal protein S6